MTEMPERWPRRYKPRRNRSWTTAMHAEREQAMTVQCPRPPRGCSSPIGQPCRNPRSLEELVNQPAHDARMRLSPRPRTDHRRQPRAGHHRGAPVTDTDDRDLTSGATTAPIHRATAAIEELLSDPAGDMPEISARRLAEAALAHSATAYVPPSRPIEVHVAIEDEDGSRVEQTLHLTREQATPEVIGTALGNLAVATLAGHYVTGRRAELGDAVRAVADVVAT